MKELEEAREVARRTLNTCRELSDKSREDEAEIERLNHELISLQVRFVTRLLNASCPPLTRLYVTRLLNASYMPLTRLLHSCMLHAS